MEIIKAKTSDIDLLIKLRLAYLSAEKDAMSLEEQEDIHKQLITYFQKWIANDGFVAFFAQENENVLSTAFLSIAERPPRTAFSSYKVGTIYNVFTYAEHRRKGLASKVLTALLKEAQSLGVASVDLLATKDGKFVYEKLGFQIANYTPMKKRLL